MYEVGFELVYTDSAVRQISLYDTIILMILTYELIWLWILSLRKYFQVEVIDT